MPYQPQFEVELEDFGYEVAGQALRALWKKNLRPDAVFCFADILAIGVLHAAHQMNINVPGELAIAGFGNDDTGRFITPSITTMSQPSFEMGQMAAEMLLEEINSEEDVFEYKTRIIKPELIVREST
jgi:LacI family transcriptional regulator